MFCCGDSEMDEKEDTEADQRGGRRWRWPTQRMPYIVRPDRRTRDSTAKISTTAWGDAYRIVRTMESPQEAPTPVRFGVFEVDLQAHTLRKSGNRVRLQDLPFRLLIMLLERPGDVITREELQGQLWPDDQYGEFDIGLNTAVTKLRHALGDSAHSPRYIETIPRVGYRFIGQVGIQAPTATPTPADSDPRAAWTIATVFGLALLILLVVHFSEPAAVPQEHPTRRFHFEAPGAPGAVISPDGRYVAYVAVTERGSSIWLRWLATDTVSELPGTEGAEGLFWSPDSSSLGFAVGHPEYVIKSIAIDGHNLATLCTLPGERTGSQFRGGAWSPDGEQIVFSWRGRLYGVSSLGGAAQVLVGADEHGKADAMYPHYLPEGDGPKALIYGVRSSQPLEWAIVSLNLETGERIPVAPGSYPVYSREGYIVHGPATGSGVGLWALPFSLKTLSVTGEEILLAASGGAASFSNEGAVVYRDMTGPEMGLKTLVWRERRGGAVIDTVGKPQPGLREFSISPDGNYIAATVDEPCDIWIQEPERSMTRNLTPGENCEYLPTWSPGGLEIVYTLQGVGDVPTRAMTRSADGSGAPAVLIQSDKHVSYASWSRDGSYLVYQEQAIGETQADIGYIQINSDGSALPPKTFVGTSANETAPMLSPNGQYLAYVSNRTGGREVYIRSFPDGVRDYQVSINGGAQPRWRSDSKELYYVEGSDTLFAVPISLEPQLTFGGPEELFHSPDLNFRYQPWPLYDVSADGQRFMTSTSVLADAPTTIRIVENWHEEFQSRQQ